MVIPAMISFVITSFCHPRNLLDQQASSRSQKNWRERGNLSSETVQLPSDNLTSEIFRLDGAPRASAFGETFPFRTSGQGIMEHLFIFESGP
jgi:hypothetical protein